MHLISGNQLSKSLKDQCAASRSPFFTHTRPKFIHYTCKQMALMLRCSVNNANLPSPQPARLFLRGLKKKSSICLQFGQFTSFAFFFPFCFAFLLVCFIFLDLICFCYKLYLFLFILFWFGYLFLVIICSVCYYNYINIIIICYVCCIYLLCCN